MKKFDCAFVLPGVEQAPVSFIEVPALGVFDLGMYYVFFSSRSGGGRSLGLTQKVNILAFFLLYLCFSSTSSGYISCIASFSIINLVF